MILNNFLDLLAGYILILYKCKIKSILSIRDRFLDSADPNPSTTQSGAEAHGIFCDILFPYTEVQVRESMRVSVLGVNIFQTRIQDQLSRNGYSRLQFRIGIHSSVSETVVSGNKREMIRTAAPLAGNRARIAENQSYESALVLFFPNPWSILFRHFIFSSCGISEQKNRTLLNRRQLQRSGENL